MKNMLLAILILSAIAYSDAERELAHIQVHEWGVLTWVWEAPVFSAVPGASSFESVTSDDLMPGGGDVMLRAPVLYFHGPAFSGTVTVKTNNGSFFDIYPSVPDADSDHIHCTWRVDFSHSDIEEYPDFHGMAPGEWNYALWREVYALSISRADGWNDKFLYYETAPETTDFLPYTPGVESLCEEYMDVEALLIKERSDGIFYSHCTLRDIVYGGDMEYTGINSEDILRVLYGWSVNVIEIDEVDALWNTWSTWVLRDHMSEPAYNNGLVMYMIPAELTEKLSIISVIPDGPRYPVDISRYLIAAIPL